MQITTFAAIDIGTYDVTLEIFEISKKAGIHSIDTVRHRLELGRDTYASGKSDRRWWKSYALFFRILYGS